MKTRKLLGLALALCMLLSCTGVYAETLHGSATGRNGAIDVDVTVNGDKIESIVVTGNNETVGVADAALVEIPARMVESQSLQVDAMTGATITCYGIMSAVKAALKDAKIDTAPFEVKPVAKAVSSETVELEAEVVVIGAGAAGMSTAVSAAQNGAKSVIVLEKESTIGGNAIVSGGYLEYMNAPEELLPDQNEGSDQEIEALLAMDVSDNELMQQWQETLAKDYAAYKASGSGKLFDSNELLAMQYHTLNLGRPDDQLIDIAKKSHEICEWFTSMDVQWNKLVGIIGFPWERWASIPNEHGGNGYFAAMKRAIAQDDLPVEIMTETTATELITDNGKVIGVAATGRNGEKYAVKTTRGVVLATGGFSANGDMLVQYNTQWDGLTNKIHSTNRSGAMGDGIVMAQAVGAGVALMDQYMLFPMSSPTDGMIYTAGINCNGALYVNKEGKRFVDETTARNFISAAIFNQTDGICYALTDAGSSGITDGWTSAAMGTPMEADFLVKSHALYVDDTLEGLAAQIGVDSQALLATVEAFNQSVATYTDEEFGRRSFNDSDQFTDGPYYAAPRAPAVHITIGGLLFGADCHVLTEMGQPIEGLYAVGEVVVGGAALSSFADGMRLGQSLMAK